MKSALLIAGAVAALAGLGAIALGIPVKEFSFGNTMILSGTMGVCTGLVLFGLSLVVGELKVIGNRLRLRAGAEPGTNALQLPDSDAQGAPREAAPPVEDLWREGGSPRGRSRQLEFAAPPPEPEPPRPRRNLMFATASRKERERADKEKWGADPLAAEFRSPPISGSDLGEQPMAEPPTIEEPAPPAFDDTWPKPERIRAQESPPLPPPLPRRPARAAPAFSEPGERSARSDESPAVSVIKSGVVDGMAYSLYSDGSIEAQMPEGMMRFGSIDQLRTHLDRRG